VDTDHVRRAEGELTFRDLIHDVGLNHFPDKDSGGNAAWLASNAIAHNLKAGSPDWGSRHGR
jgi:hypothetical protein